MNTAMVLYPMMTILLINTDSTNANYYYNQPYNYQPTATNYNPINQPLITSRNYPYPYSYFSPSYSNCNNPCARSTINYQQSYFYPHQTSNANYWPSATTTHQQSPISGQNQFQIIDVDPSKSLLDQLKAHAFIPTEIIDEGNHQLVPAISTSSKQSDFTIRAGSYPSASIVETKPFQTTITRTIVGDTTDLTGTSGNGKEITHSNKITVGNNNDDAVNDNNEATSDTGQMDEDETDDEAKKDSGGVGFNLFRG